MLDIFRGLKSLVKISHIQIDSPVFRLHYSITVMMLISFSLIVTTRQYVGNPIDCVHTKDIPEDVLNTYCWIHSTYALKSMFLKKTGKEVPYPGVGNSEGKLDDRKIYRYYQVKSFVFINIRRLLMMFRFQWVCFCLFFQVKKTIPLLTVRNK
jgi:innexin